MNYFTKGQGGDRVGRSNSKNVFLKQSHTLLGLDFLISILAGLQFLYNLVGTLLHLSRLFLPIFNIFHCEFDEHGGLRYQFSQKDHLNSSCSSNAVMYMDSLATYNSLIRKETKHLQ